MSYKPLLTTHHIHVIIKLGVQFYHLQVMQKVFC